MYRVVLVDDEPLILAGIASLLTWEDYDCTIVGKATNGPSAYEMILELKPDIVITDIRMPVLNGLELVEKCKAAGLDFSFLVLTNLEDFQLARQALILGASEYLVKLNLKPEDLVQALDRAKSSCDKIAASKQQLAEKETVSPVITADSVRNYFHQVLISENSPEEIPDYVKEVYEHPFIILFSIRQDSIRFQPEEEMTHLKQTSGHILDILKGIASRFFKQITFLNYNTTTFLLVGNADDQQLFEKTASSFCTKTNTALKTYFELTAVFGISHVADSLETLPGLFEEAQTALEYYYYASQTPVVFYRGQKFHKSKAQNFNINFLKKDLSASIQQNDSEKLSSIFNQIIDLFTQCTPSKKHAASACINIYTYLYSFFENEDDIYQDIFPYTINVAEYLNHFTSLADILEWLESFRNKLCKLLDDRKENRSDKLVEQATRYITEHYTEKLTLTEIADVLNISAGHLSITFKKFTGTNLSDYIASVKIEHAKELIDTHQYLMYEISDMLGFDNPYYFSKVFKKVTGISPRDHEKRN